MKKCKINNCKNKVAQYGLCSEHKNEYYIKGNIKETDVGKILYFHAERNKFVMGELVLIDYKCYIDIKINSELVNLTFPNNKRFNCKLISKSESGINEIDFETDINELKLINSSGKGLLGFYETDILIDIFESKFFVNNLQLNCIKEHFKILNSLFEKKRDEFVITINKKVEKLLDEIEILDLLSGYFNKAPINYFLDYELIIGIEKNFARYEIGTMLLLSNEEAQSQFDQSKNSLIRLSSKSPLFYKTEIEIKKCKKKPKPLIKVHNPKS